MTKGATKNKKKVPQICDGCPTGTIEYLIIKDDGKWSAQPCLQVKKRGKLIPQRVNWCVHHYND